MSHASTKLHSHESRTRPSVGIVPIIVAAIVVVAAAALSAWRLAAPEVRAAGVAPPATQAVAAAPDTSVPRASTVFAGSDAPQEEAAPTF